MNFGQALEVLKEGKRVARAGWSGKGIFIYLVRGCEVHYDNLRNEAQVALAKTPTPGNGIRRINSHIDMYAADGSVVVGWLASQTDMLAEDWNVLD